MVWNEWFGMNHGAGNDGYAGHGAVIFSIQFKLFYFV